jgi:hypothetical protein
MQKSHPVSQTLRRDHRLASCNPVDLTHWPALRVTLKEMSGGWTAMIE